MLAVRRVDRLISLHFSASLTVSAVAVINQLCSIPATIFGTRIYGIVVASEYMGTSSGITHYSTYST